MKIGILVAIGVVRMYLNFLTSKLTPSCPSSVGKFWSYMPLWDLLTYILLTIVNIYACFYHCTLFTYIFPPRTTRSTPQSNRDHPSKNHDGSSSDPFHQRITLHTLLHNRLVVCQPVYHLRPPSNGSATRYGGLSSISPHRIRPHFLLSNKTITSLFRSRASQLNYHDERYKLRHQH